MSGDSKLILLDKADKIYASPEGTHYHLNRDCVMLQGGDFKKFGYVEITQAEVVKRKLAPCTCAYMWEGKAKGRSH